MSPSSSSRASASSPTCGSSAPPTPRRRPWPGASPWSGRTAPRSSSSPVRTSPSSRRTTPSGPTPWPWEPTLCATALEPPRRRSWWPRARKLSLALGGDREDRGRHRGQEGLRRRSASCPCLQPGALPRPAQTRPRRPHPPHGARHHGRGGRGPGLGGHSLEEGGHPLHRPLRRVRPRRRGFARHLGLTPEAVAKLIKGA